MTMNSDSWHLDKKVPVSLIITSIVQIMALVWLAAQMSADIQTNRRDIDRAVTQLDKLQNESNSQAVQLGRIEEGIFGMRRDIQSVLEAVKDAQKTNDIKP